MDTKFVVTQMSVKEKTITQLKADIAGITLDDLVVEAINRLEPETRKKNCMCGGDTEELFSDYHYKYTINEEESQMIIKNFPYLKCCKESCRNERFAGFNTVLYLERLLELEVNSYLKRNLPIPEIMSFKELVSM